MKALFTPLKWGSGGTQSNEDAFNTESEESGSSSADNFQSTHMEDSIFSYPAPPVPRPFSGSSEKQEDEQEDTNNAPTGSPNQLLASFFQKKGSEPLSDIEAAGVMSILNRQAMSNQTSTSPSIYSIHSPSLKRFDEYPSMSNMFTPKGSNKRLKRPSDQTVNTPQKISSQSTSTSSSPKYSPLFGSNKKKRPSQSPSFTPRKMTHFSSIPTPYRPTTSSNVYQAITSSESSPTESTTNEDDIEVEIVETASVPEKSMSQTASTLLSLIDDEVIEPAPSPVVEKEKPKPFVNPYASTASRSSPRTNNQAKLVRKPSLPPTNVVQNLERTMPVNGTSPSQNSSTPQKRTIPAYLDKYKPTRSSTLRQSLIPSPSSSPNGQDDENDQSFVLSPNAKRSESSSTTIIEHSKLTPTWTVPDFLDEDEEPEPSKTLYPDLSKPVVPSQGSFDFGKTSAVEKTASKPFTFVSKNDTPTFANAVSTDTRSDVTKTPRLEHKPPNPLSQNSSVSFGASEKSESSRFNSAPKFSFSASTNSANGSIPAPAPVTNLYPDLEKKPLITPPFGTTTSAPLFGSSQANGTAALPNIKPSASVSSDVDMEDAISFEFPRASFVQPPVAISEEKVQSFKESFTF